MSDVVAIVTFVVGAAAIFFAGGRLSRYGDMIAELSGWGRAWVGLVLMASVTSLPELVVGVSSSALVESADLAVGNVLGACALNLLILAGLDAFMPQRQRLFAVASSSHVLAAALVIVLLATVGVALLSGDALLLTPWLGASSVLFLAVYLGSMRLIFLQSRGAPEAAAASGAPVQGGSDPSAVALGMRPVVTRFVLYAALVVVAAILLPPAAEAIAQMTGLGESFVGTVFLALTTTLPELAVSLAAIRMGSTDLAVGNLLGSNLFNLTILAVNDTVYTRGLLLADASPSHLFSVFSTIAMSAIVIIGLTYQPARSTKRFLLAGDAALILTVYAANAAMLLLLEAR